MRDRTDRDGKGKRDVKEKNFLAAVFVHGVVWAAYTDALHQERERVTFTSASAFHTFKSVQEGHSRRFTA